MIHYFPISIFMFLKKACTYKTGAAVLSIPVSVTFVEIVEVIFQDVPLKDIVLPLVLGGSLFVLYLPIYLSDFYTGVAASRHEAEGTKGYIKSSRLYSSFWKILGVLLVIFMLTIFCFFFIILSLDFLYKIFLYGMGAFMLMVYAFDIHSIGENVERKTGNKPKFFSFFEKALDVLENGILNKLKHILK